jgi:hypothetical protein
MKPRVFVLIGVVTVIVVIAVIVLTLIFIPEENPAFAAAVRFANAAGLGQDDVAFDLLSEEMQTYVTDNCPDGSVSACIAAYTPVDWGRLQREGAAVYRRSIPDGSAWDVQLVATYERGQGFAGVCIYHRMEQAASGDWRVAAWSGYVSCDDPNSGIQGLRRDDAPNRVP